MLTNSNNPQGLMEDETMKSKEAFDTNATHCPHESKYHLIQSRAKQPAASKAEDLVPFQYVKKNDGFVHIKDRLNKKKDCLDEKESDRIDPISDFFATNRSANSELQEAVFNVHNIEKSESIKICKSGVTKAQKESIKSRIKQTAKNIHQYSNDDSGNTDFCEDILHPYVKYNATINRYMIWNGVCWRVDTENITLRWVERCMNARRDVSLRKENKNYKNHRKYATSCSNMGRIKSVIELLKGRLTIHNIGGQMTDMFDGQEVAHLFNCMNGIINLKTGELLKHDSKYNITKISPCIYSPDADCPRFKKFFGEIFNHKEKTIKYMQVLMGYCLTGEVREQLAHIMKGTGGNGKTTLFNVTLPVMGEYAYKFPTSVISGNDVAAGAPNPELAQMMGIRLAICSELKKGTPLNESKLKLLVGSGRINVRQLHQEPFEYTPQFKICLDTNYLPEIQGSDDGIWRRIRVIPFEVKFSEENKDKSLEDTLKNEANGILTWLVEGAMFYYKNGLPPMPKSIRKATFQYQKNQNSIRAFIEECIYMTGNKNDTIEGASLYNAYVDFCTEFDLPEQSNTAFGTIIKQTISHHRSNRGIVYDKIKIRPSIDNQDI